MRISVKARHLPPRLATGAFILNSGIGKLSADEATAAQLHGFAAGTYPFHLMHTHVYPLSRAADAIRPIARCSTFSSSRRPPTRSVTKPRIVPCGCGCRSPA